MRLTLGPLPAVLLLLASLSACSSRRDPNVVEIGTFADPDGIAVQKKLLQEFEKKSGIKTRLTFIPYGNFTEKVVAQMSARTEPDLLWVEVGFYVDLQHAGALLPLDEFIAQDKLDLKQYYDGVMARFRRDGKVWALPNDTAPAACLYYNKALFKAAGVAFPTGKWTWNDLLKAAQKLMKRDKDGRAEVWGYGDGYGPDWLNWVYANGGQMVDDVKDPKRCLLNRPEALEAAQFLHDLMYKHKVMMSSANREMMDSNNINLFKTGKMAMVRSGFWQVSGLRKDTPDLDWDIAPFPKGPKAKRFGWSTGGSGWAMTRDAKDPAKAWKVLRYLSGPDYQKSFLPVGGMQPGWKALANTPEFLSGKPANAKMMLSAPDYAIFSPEIPEYTEILNSVISPKMDKVNLKADADIPGVLKEITAEVDKRLAARKR